MRGQTDPGVIRTWASAGVEAAVSTKASRVDFADSALSRGAGVQMTTRFRAQSDL